MFFFVKIYIEILEYRIAETEITAFFSLHFYQIQIFDSCVFVSPLSTSKWIY